MSRASWRTPDLALRRWAVALRADRDMHRRRLLLLALTISGVGLAGVSSTFSIPLLLWNTTSSAPPGWYLVVPFRTAHRGDWTVARLPPAVAALAARRHYLGAGIPVIKQVAAEYDDTVCATGRRITVNARIVAIRHGRDREGRPLPWWRGCTRLRHGTILLLNAAPASFDGRYFGPSLQADTLGIAYPIRPTR